jgi:hypothetical protein
MISTMAQLKNCCLGGLRAGTEREGNNDLVVDSILFSPSIYLNQLSLSRDINYPIFSDQINIFTRVFHIVHCATDNDSLRARMMSSY